MASTTKDIVLVTGANQGIGFEIAKRLLKNHPNYHVILAGRRQGALDAAAKTLADEGLTSTETAILDLGSDESIAAAARKVEGAHGRLDVLVNNAAIAFTGDDKLSPREEAKALYDTNVLGTVAVTDAFIPLLEKSDKPKRIVFVGSTAGSMGRKLDPSSFPHRSRQDLPYAATKAAAHWWASEYAARRWGDPSWKINVSCPGYCATNLNSYQGFSPVDQGAVNAVRLATLGPDGETGTFSDVDGPAPW